MVETEMVGLTTGTGVFYFATLNFVLLSLFILPFQIWLFQK